MEQQILVSEELRLRLIDLEYKDLSNKDYKAEIERIYIEETGKPIPTDIEIFQTEDSESIDNESEYVGTAIRFYSEEENIDEVYVISEGTQGAGDWLYNFEAMVAAESYEQIDEVNEFTGEAMEHFGYSYDSKEENYGVPVVGLGHSQAHNTNASAYLVHNTFTSVYSVNGAQLNFYQLFNADDDFKEHLIEEYPRLKNDDREIEKIEPKELEKIAIDFYEDKAGNIQQVLSENDPLYALGAYPGFFELGSVETYITNENVLGLRDSIDGIPLEFFRLIQKESIDFTLRAQAIGWEATISEAIGVDINILGDLKSNLLNINIDEIAEQLNETLPGILIIVYEITANSDEIFTALHEANYITKSQKDELITAVGELEVEIKNIEEQIKALEQAAEDYKISAEIVNPGEAAQALLGRQLSIMFKIYTSIKKIEATLEELEEEEYFEILKEIGDSHGIDEILAVIGSESEENKRYRGNDMLLQSTKSDVKVWVNLSATARLSVEGKQELMKKEELIRTFKKAIERDVHDKFDEQQLRAKTAANYMEQNPNSAQDLLSMHGFGPTSNRTITKIEVNSTIPAFEDTELDFSAYIHRLEGTIEEGYLLIKEYRESIEDLFKAEDEIAQQIDFLEEYYRNEQ